MTSPSYRPVRSQSSSSGHTKDLLASFSPPLALSLSLWIEWGSWRKQNKMSLCCLQGDSACRLWLLSAAAGFSLFFSCAHRMEKIFKFAQGHFLLFHMCVCVCAGIFNMQYVDRTFWKIIWRWTQRDQMEEWNYIPDEVPSDFKLTSCRDGYILQSYFSVVSPAAFREVARWVLSSLF